MSIVRLTLKTAISGPSWRIFIIVALLLFPKGVFGGEYRLQPGDTLDVLITGVPDFRQHSPIGSEGNIGLPLAGQIKVSDLSLPQARAAIAAELSNKLYRQYTTDGREISHLILGDEVVVTVSEYVPVFVNGDVAKPGAYAFRPGMTVRQAVVIAGGYDAARLQAVDPALQAADLLAEYRTLNLQYAAEQARAWRLRAELDNKPVAHKVDEAPLPDEPPGGDLTKGETKQLEARKADRESSKALLQEAIAKATLQLGILAEKKAKDEEGNQADVADFNTVRDLFRKGLAQITRLSESRRAALLSSEQLLQTVVETSNVERQRDEYARQLDKIDSQARIDNLQELQKSNLLLAQIAVRLKSTSDKLMHLGLLKPQLGQGSGARPEITIYRKGEKGPLQTAADEDLELVPGDVVGVKLPKAPGGVLISSRDRVDTATADKFASPN